MNTRFRIPPLVIGLALLLGSQAYAQLLPGNSGNSLGNSDRPRPLPMGQAFPFFVSIVDDDTLSVTWQIAQQHYLYRHQFDFSLQIPGSEQNQPVAFNLPVGLAKDDPFFGDVEVYYETVTATLTPGSTHLPSGTGLVIQYQGCAEWGFCYPPQSTIYPLAP